MLKQDFANFINDISRHFGKVIDWKNDEHKAQLDSWFGPVKDVPAEALPWIAGRIKAESDWFPRNPTKVVLTQWGAWKSAFPERTTRREEGDFDCPYCEKGKLYVVAQEVRDGEPVWFRPPVPTRQAHWSSWMERLESKERVAEVLEPRPMLKREVFGCGHCRRATGLRFVTIQQLENEGWELDRPCPGPPSQDGRRIVAAACQAAL